MEWRRRSSRNPQPPVSGRCGAVRPWPGRRLAPDVRIRGEGDVLPWCAASCPSPFGAGGGTRLPGMRVRKRAWEEDRQKCEGGQAAGMRSGRGDAFDREPRSSLVMIGGGNVARDRKHRPGPAPSRPTGAKLSAAL